MAPAEDHLFFEMASARKSESVALFSLAAVAICLRLGVNIWQWSAEMRSKTRFDGRITRADCRARKEGRRRVLSNESKLQKDNKKEAKWNTEH